MVSGGISSLRHFGGSDNLHINSVHIETESAVLAKTAGFTTFYSRWTSDEVSREMQASFCDGKRQTHTCGHKCTLRHHKPSRTCSKFVEPRTSRSLVRFCWACRYECAYTHYRTDNHVLRSGHCTCVSFVLSLPRSCHI